MAHRRGGDWQLGARTKNARLIIGGGAKLTFQKFAHPRHLQGEIIHIFREIGFPDVDVRLQ